MIQADQLRQAGFMPASEQLPRDLDAMRLLCAFNNADWARAPTAWWFHPNESSRLAWARVLREAEQIMHERRQLP